MVIFTCGQNKKMSELQRLNTKCIPRTTWDGLTITSMRFISFSPDVNFKVDHDCSLSRVLAGIEQNQYTLSPHSCKAGFSMVYGSLLPIHVDNADQNTT